MTEAPPVSDTGALPPEPAPSSGAVQPETTATAKSRSEAGATAAPEAYLASKARPEWFPEKYWRDGKGMAVHELAKGYSEASKRLSTRSDDLKAQMAAEVFGEQPEAYQFNQPADLPEGLQFEIPEGDPLYKEFTNLAKSLKLSQPNFDKIITLYAKSMIASLPDPKEEMELLGENAAQRITDADAWAKKTLPDEHYAWLTKLADTAEAIEFMEWMRYAMGEPVQGINPNPAQTPGVPQDQGKIREMMRDPRYWDPNRRDPAYIQQIDNAWKQLSNSR